MTGGGTSLWPSTQPLLCTAILNGSTALAFNKAGVMLGCRTNMSEWNQHWHQEGFHHPINNVTLVFSGTESQLFRGQSVRTAIVSSHWKQGEFWHEAEPRMTHRLTATLYCIPKITFQWNTTIVAMRSHSFTTDYPSQSGQLLLVCFHKNTRCSSHFYTCDTYLLKIRTGISSDRTIPWKILLVKSSTYKGTNTLHRYEHRINQLKRKSENTFTHLNNAKLFTCSRFLHHHFPLYHS